MKIDQDPFLFEKLKNGDKEAFNALFRKYHQQMCNYAFGYFRSVDLAREAVQDVFLSLWNNKEEITIKKSFLAFLYACVRNHCLNEIEKEKTRKSYESNYIEKQEKTEVMQDKDENVLKKALRICIEKLPEKCRDIFTMCKNEGLTYEEIAGYLEVSEKTVENQMGIAFKKLRQCLGPILATN